ncbi:MAG: helix-turn-helix domain-containing protein [Vagococcus sp.]
MNRLAYQLIVDKKIKRQIAILSVLSSQKYPATLEDLSEHIGASERTISNDIYQLIEIAPPEVKIKITPKIGITLVCDPSFLISDFILELAENNPVFEILDNLFNGVVETIEDYSERLFISESTLRQKLLVLKKVLREYQLELSLTPLALTGDEINIRCFFFSYYRNSSNKSFMMPEENQVNLHSTVIDTFKKHENGSLYSDYR